MSHKTFLPHFAPLAIAAAIDPTGPDAVTSVKVVADILGVTKKLHPEHFLAVTTEVDRLKDEWQKFGIAATAQMVQDLTVGYDQLKLNQAEGTNGAGEQATIEQVVAAEQTGQLGDTPVGKAQDGAR